MELHLTDLSIAQTEMQHVLVFGKHEYIMTNLKTQLEKADFKCSVSVVLFQVIEYMLATPPDLVVLGGGVDPHDRIKIIEAIQVAGLSTRVVEHFGGPATVISEVRAAIASL